MGLRGDQAAVNMLSGDRANGIEIRMNRGGYDGDGNGRFILILKIYLR